MKRTFCDICTVEIVEENKSGFTDQDFPDLCKECGSLLITTKERIFAKGKISYKEALISFRNYMKENPEKIISIDDVNVTIEIITKDRI